MNIASRISCWAGGWKPDLNAYLSNENTQIHSGPFIDLDYIHTVNTNVEIDFMRYGQDGSYSNGGYAGLFGARKNASQNNLYAIPGVNDRFYTGNIYYSRSSSGEEVVGTNTIGTRYKFVSNGLSYTYGETTSSVSGTISAGIGKMILFSLNVNTSGGITTDTSEWGGFAKYRIWNMKIKEGATLVADMYPREMDGECGLWDVIRKRFFGDASSSGIPLIIGRS